MTAKAPYWNAARILNSDRSNAGSSDNENITGWSTSNEFIIAIQLDETAGPWTAAYKIQWQDDASPGYVDLASSAAALIQGTGTALTDGTNLTSGNSRCTTNPGGSWADGEEVEGNNTTDSLALSDEDYTELQFAIDPSGATASHTYSFRLVDASHSDAVISLAGGVSNVTITMSAAATTYTITTDIDALLQQVGITETTDLDAILMRSYVLSASVDALVKALQSISTDLDALLQTPDQLVTTDIDALLQNVDQTNTNNIDAIVQALENVETASADALLKQINSTVQADTDALLQLLDITETADIDAVISSLNYITATIDSLIKAVDQVNTTDLDAFLKLLDATETTNVDALLSQLVLLTTDMDSLIQELGRTKTTDIDAVVEAVASTKTISTTIDSLLQTLDQTNSVVLDAILEVLTGTITWGLESGQGEQSGRKFAKGWAGTATIDNVDATSDRLLFDTGEYKESETWNIGSGSKRITLGKYGTASAGITIKYKTGSTKQDCNATAWQSYEEGTIFDSLGWAKIRVED